MRGRIWRDFLDRLLVSQSKLLFLTLIPFLGACGASQATQGSAEEVIHVVVCWLKQPGNLEQRKELIGAAKALKEIPGVLEIRSGEVVPSERLGVDSSFDVAFVFRFEDEAALRSYENHPIHLKAVSETLKPLVSKFVIYDLR